MGRPLKVQTITTPDSLKEMADAEVEFSSHIILKDFASVLTGTGTVQLDPTPTSGLTLLGTHVDTTLSINVGVTATTYSPTFQGFFVGTFSGFFHTEFTGFFHSHYQGDYVGPAFQGDFAGPTFQQNFGQFYGGFGGPPFFTGFFNETFSGFFTTTFTGFYSGASFSQDFAGPSFEGFFQDTFTDFFTGTATFIDEGTYITRDSQSIWQDRQAAVVTNTKRTLETNGTRLIEQDDDEIGTYFGDMTIADMVNNGVGSYRIQPGSPTVNGHSGTWVVRGTLINDTANGQPQDTTKFWQKTNNTAPTEIRPLHTRLNGNVYEVKEHTDVDLETFSGAFRKRINDTQIGYYAFQENAPVSGTWVRQGESFSDTVKDIDGNDVVIAAETTIATKSLWVRTA